MEVQIRKMVMPVTKMEKAEEDFLSGNNSVLCFGHVKFKTPIRHPGGEAIELVAKGILSAEDEQNSYINVTKSDGTRRSQLRRECADEGCGPRHEIFHL